ncbi:hypothetical protein C9I36_14375 [Pectobacterium punjabense]|nr:hypothetical protein C9I36_14375 [Pectobacterium punjabense]
MLFSPICIIPVILRVVCALAALLGTLACTSPRWGRCKQRSNLPRAGLSVTRITYLSKFIGIPSLAAFLKLELFRVYIRNVYVYDGYILSGYN